MPKQNFITKSYFSFILIALFAIASVFFWMNHYTPEEALLNDASAYMSVALERMSGKLGFTLSTENQGSFFDIAYPNLLAFWFSLFGVSLLAGQFLNLLLWCFSAFLIYKISHYWLSHKNALIFGCLAALSPMLTSFAPKLYSEHLAIFGGLLSLYGWFALNLNNNSLVKKAFFTLLMALGLCLLVFTKSIFFPFLILTNFLFLIKRQWTKLLPFLFAFMIVLPAQMAVQKGGRGNNVLALQVARLLSWDNTIISKCAVYSLSLNLGKLVFPEVEGACDLFKDPLTNPAPLVNRSPLPLFFNYLDKGGVSFSEALQNYKNFPDRYLLLCINNFMASVWIDGFYANAVKNYAPPLRLILWIFKVFLSTFLWFCFLNNLFKFYKDPQKKFIVYSLAIPCLYLLALHIHIHGEQRYFFPLIPLLYLSASFWVQSYFFDKRSLKN